MDDEDEQTINHKVEISGVGGLGWVFFLGILFLIFFEHEIRCSLGNARECAEMAVKLKDQK